MALRVGYEKLTRDRLEAARLLEEGVCRRSAGTPTTTTAGTAASTGSPPHTHPAGMSRVLVTGGGGFVGSHLVKRLQAAGNEVTAARRRDYDLTSMEEGTPL